MQKYGNAAAMVLLLCAAVYFIVQWRMNAAAQSRMAIATQLSTAQAAVQSLRSPNMLRQSPQEIAAFRDQVSAKATDAISSVLTTSTDAAQRAGALVARGDLNWQLANLPPLPGATTQPALRPTDKPSIMLDKAEASYKQVLSDSTFADQHEAIAAAHLGLAAIAENRNDWDSAKKNYQAVIKSQPDSPAASVARLQLAAVAGLEKPIPLVATTEPVATIGPVFHPMPPTTMPTKRAAAMPTTRPAH